MSIGTGTPGENVPVTASVILVRKHGGPCTKRIALGPDGPPTSDASCCALARGTAELVELHYRPAAALARLIDKMKPEEALILGRFADGLPPRITIDLAARANTPPARAR